MKLQKILLAVMAVVITASTVAFYRIPQPLVPENAEIKYVHMEIYRSTITDSEFVDVTDEIDLEAAAQVLRQHKRGRLPYFPQGGLTTDGMIWLDILVEENGYSYFLHGIIGMHNGRNNHVKIGANGPRLEILNAADLQTELTALLPN